MSHWVPFAICCSLFLFALIRVTNNRRRIKATQRPAIDAGTNDTLTSLTAEDQQWLEGHGWYSPLRVPDAVAQIRYVSAGAQPDQPRAPLEWRMLNATTAVGKAAIEVGPGWYNHFGLWSEAGKFLFAGPLAVPRLFPTSGLLLPEITLTSEDRTWTFL